MLEYLPTPEDVIAVGLRGKAWRWVVASRSRRAGRASGLRG